MHIDGLYERVGLCLGRGRMKKQGSDMGINIKVSIAFLFFVFPLILVSQSIAIDKSAHTYWMDTHWLFNYEHGFIKRGLIGEVFRQAGFDFTLATLTVAQTVTIFLASAAFLALVTWFVLQNYRSNDPWHSAVIVAIGLMLMTAPGALRQTVFEVGRFDAFGLVLLCTIFVVTGRSLGLFSLLFLLVALVLAIFAHEALFFWVAPLGLWLWYLRKEEATPIAMPMAAICAVAVGAVLIAGTSSYSDYLTFAEIKSDLELQTDVPIVDSSLMVQFRSLDENVARSAKYSFSYLRIIGCLIGLISLIPYVVVLWMTVKRDDRIKLRWAWVAAFAPLLLVFAGHDQGRWLAMTNASLCLVMVALLSNVRITPQQAKPLLPLICLTSVCQFFAGPFGNIVPFPYLMRFF